MKTLYFCSVALAFLFTEFSNVDAKLSIEQMKNMAKPWGKSCANKVGLSPELQEAHRRGEFPEDETLMCYLLCCAKIAKIMDKNSKIDLSTIKQQLEIIAEDEHIDRMVNVFTTCANKMTETEPCKLAWEYSKCYYDLDKEVYMFS